MSMIFLLLCLGLAYYVWCEIGKAPTDEQLKNYEKYSYFKENEFQSRLPQSVDMKNIPNKGKCGLIQLAFPSQFAPKHPFPIEPLVRESFPDKPHSFGFYWLGHSTVLMEFAGKRLLFDPVFGNASPIPFLISRYADSPISVHQLPPIDAVIITHNHYDHLERKTIQALKQLQFIVPLGVGAALRGWGVAPDHITEIAWGEMCQLEGMDIIAETAVHFSGRGYKDKNKTACNSYLIQTPDKKIFLSGDTGYSSHFSEIEQKYGAVDLAVLEIDGWNQAWPNAHLFPDQVIQAAQDLGATHLLPIHWGIFPLGLHPWHESIDKVLEAGEDAPINILTPKLGVRTDLNSETSRWWKEMNE